MGVAVVMAAFPAGGDSETFVHGDKGKEADHDGYAKQDVLVGVHKDEACVVGFGFAEEDLGEEVEERVA